MAFPASLCESTLDASASSPAESRHDGQMPSAASLSRCWLYLSRAPFCDALVSSQDSSSKSRPLKSALFILSWHLIVDATSFETILPTVSAHLRLSALFGTEPVSSSPMSTPEVASQNT